MGAFDQGADATAGRWLVMPRTLCFVLNGDDVLLMKRAAHRRVFPNRYNGVGGHVERGEEASESACREILEETGLQVRDLHLCAVNMIDAGATTGILLFVFTAYSDNRATHASDEGTLHWVPRDRIAELDLVEDLPVLLPRILAMRKDEPPLFIHVHYNADDRIHLRFSEATG